MLQKYKTKRQEGFTIIEVLIVLAIAALILLIVFLAIPALQRNQRNNARNSDASRISSATSECLSNRNGDTGACGGGTVDGLAGDRSQLTDTVADSGDGSLTGAAINYNNTCNDEGSGLTGAAASERDFAIMFQIETNGGATLQRCI